MPNQQTTAAKTVHTRQIAYMSEVLKANPEFYAEIRDHTEYKFSNGKEFKADPGTRGAYTS